MKSGKPLNVVNSVLRRTVQTTETPWGGDRRRHCLMIEQAKTISDQNTNVVKLE